MTPPIGHRIRDMMTNELGEYLGPAQGRNVHRVLMPSGMVNYSSSAFSQIGRHWFLNAAIDKSKPTPKKKRGRPSLAEKSARVREAAMSLNISVEELRRRCDACGLSVEEYLESELDESEAA